MFAKRIKKRGASGREEKKRNVRGTGRWTEVARRAKEGRKAWKNRRDIIAPNVPSRSNEASVTAFFIPPTRLPVILFPFPFMFTPIFAPLIAAFSFSLDFLSLPGRFYSRNGELAPPIFGFRYYLFNALRDTRASEFLSLLFHRIGRELVASIPFLG